MGNRRATPRRWFGPPSPKVSLVAASREIPAMPTALLVDDEPSASLRLRGLLSAHKEIEVLAAVRSVAQASRVLKEQAPDILFLDVELPGGSGLKLLAELSDRTHVCFITAHPQYAVTAFEVGAVDYLLKPIDRMRLGVAVGRLLRAIRVAELLPATGSAAESTPPAEWGKERESTFVVTLRGGEKAILRRDDILWIEGLGKYSRVCLAGERKPAIVGRSLAEWMEILPADMFPRLGRSQIIRLARLALVTWKSREETVLSFTGSPDALTIGRSAAARLRELSAAE